MKDIKNINEALYNWADESENRNVICVAAEVTNETEDGCEVSQSVLVSGKGGKLVDALVEAMRKDKNFANIIRRAAMTFAVGKLVEHLGDMSNGNEEEGDDE